jgi:hypothetical protein
MRRSLPTVAWDSKSRCAVAASWRGHVLPMRMPGVPTSIHRMTCRARSRYSAGCSAAPRTVIEADAVRLFPQADRRDVPARVAIGDEGTAAAQD